MKADIHPVSTGKIACYTEIRQKDQIKSVPGARWDPEDTLWTVPLTWSSCLALRATFGDDLEIGDSLAEWAYTYRAEVVDPGEALRDLISSDVGDPDLFPHQRADVRFLTTVKKSILASEMGVGKSAAVIRSLKTLNDRGEEVFPCLIVCPNTTKFNWQREIDQWWPGRTSVVVRGTSAQRRKQLKENPTPDFIIMNYESVKSHTRLAPYGSIAIRRCTECGGEDSKVSPARCQMHIRELNEISFRSVIADEAHRLKDPTTATSRAVKYAAQEAEYRYALTGTPIANNVLDLWSILNFVDPVEWPAKTRWIDRMVDLVYNVFGGVVVSGVKAGREKEFRDTIDHRMRRMSKDVVLPFLPPLLTERRDVPMTTKQEKAYRQMVDHMMARIDDDDLLVATSPLTQTMRLCQLASSYGEVVRSEKEIITDTGVIAVEADEKFLLSSPSSKIEAFIDDLPDYDGRSVVVFAVSRQLIMLLSAALEKHKIEHGLIVGGQTTLDRQIAIDDFQDGKTKFILVTVAAGGTGINLTAADTMVYLQRSWSLIDMQQSEARARRIGSERHESILRIDYVTPGTIEEAVIAALDNKGAGLEELVRDHELLMKAAAGGY